VTATIGPHPGMRGVWCVFVDDGTGEDHYRILSTHATRDGAAVSANQVNRAEIHRVCSRCMGWCNWNGVLWTCSDCGEVWYTP